MSPDFCLGCVLCYFTLHEPDRYRLAKKKGEKKGPSQRSVRFSCNLLRMPAWLGVRVEELLKPNDDLGSEGKWAACVVQKSQCDCQGCCVSHPASISNGNSPELKYFIFLVCISPVHPKYTVEYFYQLWGFFLP